LSVIWKNAREPVVWKAMLAHLWRRVEIGELQKNYLAIKPYLSEEGIEAIEKLGVWVFDTDGEKGTSTIGQNGACAFSLRDEKGVLKCGIEQAYLDGKSTFRKPISCHLYPIRITKYDQYDALNYDRWEICDAACVTWKNTWRASLQVSERSTSAQVRRGLV
jgi:hypothetical protein